MCARHTDNERPASTLRGQRSSDFTEGHVSSVQGCDLELVSHPRREKDVYSVWFGVNKRPAENPDRSSPAASLYVRQNMHKHTTVAFFSDSMNVQMNADGTACTIYHHMCGSHGSHGFSAVALETLYKHSCFVFPYLSSTFRVNRCVFIEPSDVSLRRGRLGLSRRPSLWKRCNLTFHNL